MTKFRQHCRIKTEIEDPIQNETVLNQVMMKKRSNQPILVHITKKKFSCNPHKIQNNSNRNSERDKDVDGFMMTFSKIRERKHSDINVFESVKKTKRYWKVILFILWAAKIRKGIISGSLTPENCVGWVLGTQYHCLGQLTPRATPATAKSYVLT